MAQLRNASIDEYQPDPDNLNKGTERGEYMIRQSLAKLGAGRSIVVDAKGRTIGGAHVLQAAEDLSLPVVEVVTDGTELVVVKRIDLDYDETGKARELSIADNRTAEIGINFDYEAVLETAKSLDISDWFTSGEMERMAGDVKQWDSSIPPLEEAADEEEDKDATLKLMLSATVKERFLMALKSIPGATNEERILVICELIEASYNQ